MITFQSKDLPKYFSSCQVAFDSFLAKAKADGAMMGWVNLPHQESLITESLNWKKKMAGFTDLGILGIGGSSLGARAVLDVLVPAGKVHFFENVDPVDFYGRINTLSLGKTHFLVISKSGKTLETLGQLRALLEIFEEEGISAQKHLTVVTEKGPNPLVELGRELNLTQFEIPRDVGGRFSVFSNVGVLPLAWAGVDLGSLMAGARWAQQEKTLVSSICNSVLHSLERQEWITVFWIYSQLLRTWGLWLEQLWAESLAKKSNRKGADAPRVSTPITAIGATDQHSLLQQFMDGASDKLFFFVRCSELESSQLFESKQSPRTLKALDGLSLGQLLAIEAQAIQESLEISGKKTALLTLDKLDAWHLGALLSLFEMVVAVLGECLDIDVFDQPGVELGKKLMQQRLGPSR